VHLLIHLFKSDLFVAEYFADKNSALVPANVPAVVHSPCLERSWILEALHAAGEEPGAGHVDTPWRLIGKRLMWALMVEDQAETIKLLLLCRRGRPCRLEAMAPLEPAPGITLGAVAGWFRDMEPAAGGGS
jgi:hypothetical protein